MADWVEETESVYPGRDLLTFLSIRIGLGCIVVVE